MKRAVLVALLALVPSTANAQSAAPITSPPRPPDGTYRYSLSQGGKNIGTSQVVFRSEADRVTVTEKATLGEFEATTVTVLDATTLEEQEYRGSSPQQGGFFALVDDGGVTLKSGDVTLPVKSLPGTAGVMVSDGLVSSFTLLPAIARTARNASLTDVAVNGAKAVALAVKPITDTAPSGVPAGDAGLEIDAGSVSFQVWCDPNTLVVHLVRGGPNAFEIRLTS